MGDEIDGCEVNNCRRVLGFVWCCEMNSIRLGMEGWYSDMSE